jgi:hypothetical protein
VPKSKHRILCRCCQRNPPMMDRRICFPCDSAEKRKFDTWRKKKLAAGLCTRCGKNPICPESKVRCRDCYRKHRTDATKRVAVIESLGDCCACCGLDDRRFLTLDHKLNNGTKDRTNYGETYRRAFEPSYEFPIQVLCWNCNMAKGIYRGTCPHKILIEGDSWNVVK